MARRVDRMSRAGTNTGTGLSLVVRKLVLHTPFTTPILSNWNSPVHIAASHMAEAFNDTTKNQPGTREDKRKKR